MFKALVFIRNLESSAKRLDFGKFTVELEMRPLPRKCPLGAYLSGKVCGS
jgi:hypothetical protein